MENTWGENSGQWVNSFSFQESDINTLKSYLKGFFRNTIDEEYFICSLETTITKYLLIKADHDLLDKRKETISKLNKIINGLTKSINALQSLDSHAQAIYSQHCYFSEFDLSGSKNINRLTNNPADELSIMLEAAQQQLNDIHKDKYTRDNALSFLVEHIIKHWLKYSVTTLTIDTRNMPWRDVTRGKRTPEIALWQVVKLALLIIGTPLQDPSNHIKDALEHLQSLDTNGG
ncbi:hypothetical protein [Pseudoalteromonas sp. SG43-5]|uniref:hypothetical protein n=1 Tax=Pseudoalteromonas sp. SG43-5 TaxID=2760968 RepID=UPI0015FF9772|nr:hypothetical protein [Pseudoalteromonas sp. SG43-5]MBB1455216.1 hypothetical protein [Pseudoalteromonas sp. SG43-5]